MADAERLRELLRCPHDGDMLDGDLHCPRCAFGLRPAASPPRVWSVPDADARGPQTLAQRSMESPHVVPVYEGRWRPALMRAVTRFGDADEDAALAVHLPSPAGCTVAELCCGPARVSRALVARGAEVLGVDVSLPMLTEARRRCGDACLLLAHADASRPLLARGRFDAVVCFAALHLLDDPHALLASAAEALRPGGVVLVWSLVRRGALLATLPPALLGRIGLHPIAAGDLAAALATRGLTVVASRISGGVELAVARR